MPELGPTARWVGEKRCRILIGLNVDAEPDGRVQQFLKKVPVNYPIYIWRHVGNQPTVCYGELTVPLSLVIDQNGRVEQLISGWSSDTQRRFETFQVPMLTRFIGQA